MGLLDLETARWVDVPRAEQVIGVREPDVSPFVIGKVEVVRSERIFDPVWDMYERRALDVLSDARVQFGPNDRHIEQPFNVHILHI